MKKDLDYYQKWYNKWTKILLYSFVFFLGRMSCVKLDTLQDVVELVKTLNKR